MPFCWSRTYSHSPLTSVNFLRMKSLLFSNVNSKVKINARKMKCFMSCCTPLLTNPRLRLWCKRVYFIGSVSNELNLMRENFWPILVVVSSDYKRENKLSRALYHSRTKNYTDPPSQCSLLCKSGKNVALRTQNDLANHTELQQEETKLVILQSIF